ncbi:hypothetical protein BHMPCIPO_03731 [Ensifer sesbaniae]|nr:hypothetical protein [Ensifer sesbaniae]
MAAQRDRRDAVLRREVDRAARRLRGIGVVAGIAVRHLARTGRLEPAHRQALLVDRRVRAAGRRDRHRRCRIAEADRQRRMRQVAVAVLHRVGEHVAATAGRTRIAHVAVAAIRVQRQLAEQAVDLRAHRRRIVQRRTAVAGDNADHARPVRADSVRTGIRRAGAADHVARRRRVIAGCYAVRVEGRNRRIVDDRDHQVARRGGIAVGVADHHREARRGVVARGVVGQRVGIDDRADAGRRVIAVVRRQRARRIAEGLRYRRQRMAAQRDRRDAVLRREVDRAARRLRGIGVVAGIAVRHLARTGRLEPAHRQALLVDRRVRAAGRRDRHRRCRIAEADRQRRMRQVAVAVLHRVGEHVAATAGRTRIAHVAVAAIRVQRQLAEQAVDLRAHRRRIVQRRTAVAGDNADHARPVRADSVRTGIRRAGAADHVARRRRVIAGCYAVQIRHDRRNVVRDRNVHRAFGLVAVGIGGDHLDRAEVCEVVDVNAGMAGVVVVQRRRHRRAVAAAHQVERHDCNAAGAADDLRVGDAIPGQCAAQAAGVAEGNLRDRIRTGDEADRAAARVGAGRRRAVGKVLVVEVEGSRGEVGIDRRASAVGHRDRLAVARRVAVGVRGRQREADIDAAGIVEVVGRSKRPALVGIDRQRALGQREHHLLAGRKRQHLRRVADRHVHRADTVSTGRKRPVAGQRLTFDHVR